jgi:CubicO group peptidase (beta-lactamase class C family)
MDQTPPQVPGWMQGSPPPPERRIRFADADHLSFPKSRWSFNHLRELVPTACIGRGAAAPAALDAARLPAGDAGAAWLDALRFDSGGGTTMNWAQALEQTHVDGIVVLHRGAIAYEAYFGEGAAHRPHLCFSVTKSVVGLAAAVLVHDGELDAASPVGRIVPELQASAFGDASVRDLLDMLVGLSYSEDTADPSAAVWRFYRAGGILPAPPGYEGPRGFARFLPSVEKGGAHGASFDYKTVNTQVLGWVLERVTGMPLAELLSRMIWSRLGAEQDAYISVDENGMAYAGGGMCATVRDLARLGELLRNDGRRGSAQVVPAAVVADIRAGGDRERFAGAPVYRATLGGWSYRNCWWISHDAHGVFMARGIHGQSLYIDPLAQVVIARVGSHPISSSVANDPITLPAFAAIARALMDRAA